MSSIKQKITRPYIILTVIMQVIIIGLFNITVTFYSYAQAENELLKSVRRIENNIKYSGYFSDDSYRIDGGNGGNGVNGVNGVIGGNGGNGGNGGKHPPLFDLMVTNDNIYVIIVDSENQYTATDMPGKNRLSEQAAQLAIQNIETVSPGEIVSFYHAGQYYNAMQIQDQSLLNGDKVIYVSVGFFVEGFVETINIILILISLVVLLIFIFVSNRLAKGIANPIQDITGIVKKMKTNELLSIDEAQDSDELQQLSREINAMSSRIYHYDKAQKSFLHNASHELRTPLMNIGGYAEGMVQGVFTNETGLDVIMTETARLKELVDKLLTLEKIDNFDVTLPTERVDIVEFLEDIVKSFNGVALKQQKEIVVNFKQTSLFLDLSPELLRQAVVNILSNGLRYANKTVLLTVGQNNNIVEISIKDDGVGISEQDLEHVFERFYKGEGGKYGLGLSIAKSAIEQLGGTLEASNVTDGALFLISLSK